MPLFIALLGSVLSDCEVFSVPCVVFSVCAICDRPVMEAFFNLSRASCSSLLDVEPTGDDGCLSLTSIPSACICSSWPCAITLGLRINAIQFTRCSKGFLPRRNRRKEYRPRLRENSLQLMSIAERSK